MENDVKERVKLVMKELEISTYAVAKFRGISDRTMLDQINGNSKIGVSTIEALLAYRPDLSAEWLLRGVGSMLIPDHHATASEIDELRDTIRRQRREIDGLYERIEELKRNTDIKPLI